MKSPPRCRGDWAEGPCPAHLLDLSFDVDRLGRNGLPSAMMMLWVSLGSTTISASASVPFRAFFYMKPKQHRHGRTTTCFNHKAIATSARIHYHSIECSNASPAVNATPDRFAQTGSYSLFVPLALETSTAGPTCQSGG